MRIPRSDFLAGSVLGTLAAAATPGDAAPASGGPASAGAPAFDEPVPFAFDRAAFAALLDAPFPHRQIAAATTFNSASTALHFLKNSIEAYADPRGFAAGPNALHAVAVLYGGPSPVVALADAVWARYPIGDVVRSSAKPAIASTAADPAPKTNASADLLTALATHHGAHFFVCNNALSGIAVRLAKADMPGAQDPTRAAVVAVHADLVAHLLPGAVLVPAGVAALCAAQEARFTLIPPNG